MATNHSHKGHIVNKDVPIATIEAYLPANYIAVEVDGVIHVTGTDVAGWTWVDYVVPRLASGLYTLVEDKDIDDDSRLTFSEMYDARVACMAQVTTARKALQRLRNKQPSRNRSTANAIERWEDMESTYLTLARSIDVHIHKRLQENDAR